MAIVRTALVYESDRHMAGLSSSGVCEARPTTPRSVFHWQQVHAVFKESKVIAPEHITLSMAPRKLKDLRLIPTLVCLHCEKKTVAP